MSGGRTGFRLSRKLPACAQKEASGVADVAVASREHYTERQYAVLVELAREVMDVLASVQAGETIAPE